MAGEDEDHSHSHMNNDDVVLETKSSEHEKSVIKGLNRTRKFFYVIIPIATVIIGYFLSQSTLFGNIKGEDGGVLVNGNIYKLFEQYDKDSDGYLSPVEFQDAYYELRSGTEEFKGQSFKKEIDTYDVNVKEFLQNRSFSENEEIVHLKASFTPMDLNTMQKSKDYNPLTDPSSSFHLHGLTNWISPNIEHADFPVSDFGVFLPSKMTSINPGSTWDIIGTVLASITHGSKLLDSNRYMPPKPNNPTETFLLHLLSMIHKRPFLHMRFPPRGGIACLQAVSEQYYNIIFRLHPEFQLNEPPRYPFWFTPAALIGELKITKDGSHIDYFKVYLPNHIKLNIDMEWITGLSGMKGNSNHDGEVDIGYVEEMVIESQGASKPLNNITEGNNISKESNWIQEISKEQALSILEKEFYPFKKVPYVPFNKSFEMAKQENKLIHHILLWGSLDDQSC